MISLILFTSCAGDNAKNNPQQAEQSDNENSVSVSSDDTDEDDFAYYLKSYEERYDFCKENFPDKTVLTWLTDAYVTHEDKLNDYLYSNGYDYVICFDRLEAFTSEDRSDTYLKKLDDYVQSGRNFDILGSFGVALGIDDVSNSYYYLAEKGMFEPLDSYITDENYADYVSLLPENYWNSYKYSGHLYGIDNTYSTLYSDFGIRIDNDILEQSGVKAEDFDGTIADTEKAYRKIYEQTGKSIDFYRTFITDDIFAGNYICNGIAIQNGKTVNVFDMAESKDYYKSINELAKKDYITIDNTNETLTAGYNISAHGISDKIIVNNTLGTTKIYNQINNYICNPTNANGVCSKSENKDLSVKALFDVTFDKNINNILTYGIEDEDYELEDGCVVMNDTDEHGISNSIDSSFNNPLVSYPCEQIDDEIVSIDYYKLYDNAEILDGFGFYFDVSKVSISYKNILSKIMEFEPNIDKNADIQTYIDNFNKELNDTGLHEVLDEADKQLEKYNEKNN